MSSGSSADGRRPSVRHFARLREKHQPIVVVSAYDALFARLSQDAGVDAILVGDSLGNVILGLESTVPVSLEAMIHHASAVRRGAPNTLVIADMPFLTYQVSAEDAMRNCGTVVQRSGAQAVKLEGGSPEVMRAVEAVVRLGVPVMGHLGFTPQAIHALGGARVQGRDADGAQRIIDAARRLEDAGAFSLVLELVPAEVAGRVREAVSIPTIGIGAGVNCDGQVLVLLDLLGLNDGFAPKFLKKYAALADGVRDAVRQFGEDVRAGRYPGPEHTL